MCRKIINTIHKLENNLKFPFKVDKHDQICQDYDMYAIDFKENYRKSIQWHIYDDNKIDVNFYYGF